MYWVQLHSDNLIMEKYLNRDRRRVERRGDFNLSGDFGGVAEW